MIRDVQRMLFSLLALWTEHCFLKGMKKIPRMCPHHISVEPGTPLALHMVTWGFSWNGIWIVQAAQRPAKMLRRILMQTAQPLSCVITSCSLWQSCAWLHRSLLREKCQLDWGWMTEDHRSCPPYPGLMAAQTVAVVITFGDFQNAVLNSP